MSVYKWDSDLSPVHNMFMTLVGIDGTNILPITDYKTIYAFVDWGKVSLIRHPHTERYPLVYAAEQGLRVHHGLKSIYESNSIAITETDPLTQLEIFIVASASEQSRLETIYYLLLQHPHALMNHIHTINSITTLSPPRKKYKNLSLLGKKHIE